MTTDDNDSLMKIADEFIALAVRAYDTVANELRWLVVPRVVQRRFQCRQRRTLGPIARALRDCRRSKPR
jgi:hypothetical protein